MVLREALDSVLGYAAAGASPPAQPYESYDYAEVKQFRLVIPKGLKTERGILVVCNYAAVTACPYCS